MKLWAAALLTPSLQVATRNPEKQKLKHKGEGCTMQITGSPHVI
jgi:hypothetical protein